MRAVQRVGLAIALAILAASVGSRPIKRLNKGPLAGTTNHDMTSVDELAPVNVQLLSDRPFHEILIPFSRDKDKALEDGVGVPLRTNTGTYTAYVDTGSAFITVPEKMLARLKKCEVKDGYCSVSGIGFQTNRKIGRDRHEVSLKGIFLKTDDFSISGMKFHKPIVGFEEDTVAGLPQGYQATGEKPLLIGNHVFHNTVLSIDYPNRLLHVFSPDYVVPAAKSGISRIALQLVRDTESVRSVDTGKLSNSFLIVKGALEGRPVQIVLDTGSTSGSISEDLAKKYRHRVKKGKVFSKDWVLKGFHPTVSGLAGRIGNCVFFDQYEVDDEETMGGSNTILLGGSFLKHFIVTIDYPRQMVYLDRPASESASPITDL